MFSKIQNNALWKLLGKKLEGKNKKCYSFLRLGPKIKKFSKGHRNHLPGLGNFSGVRNVLLDSYDDSLETLSIFTLFRAFRELNFGKPPYLGCKR